MRPREYQPSTQSVYADDPDFFSESLELEPRNLAAQIKGERLGYYHPRLGRAIHILLTFPALVSGEILGPTYAYYSGIEIGSRERSNHRE